MGLCRPPVFWERLHGGSYRRETVRVTAALDVYWKGRNGGGRGKSSDWLVIDGLFAPSETSLPPVPMLCSLSLFQSLLLSLSSISLPLMLLNALPSVPSLWVQVALPDLHYMKASMLRSWQPALHCPDVITTRLPWNWSFLALWQLGNPPLFQLCVH